jgi:hypothetical protein
MGTRFRTHSTAPRLDCRTEKQQNHAVMSARQRLIRRVEVTTPPRERGGFVRNACVHNHYVSPNRLSPSPKIS